MRNTVRRIYVAMINVINLRDGYALNVSTRKFMITDSIIVLKTDHNLINNSRKILNNLIIELKNIEV